MSIHHFDLVFARRGDGAPPYFVNLLEREAQARGMIFFHCQQHDHAETLRLELYRGTLRIDGLLDYMGRSFQSDYELGCAVKDAGGLVIDDPDRVKIYGDKAVMHQELVRLGQAMPRTILWRPDQPSRDLTPAERAFLGPRIVCKPACGSGSGGVVLDLDGSCAMLDAAREYDTDDTYLLQEFVQPLDLDGRPAWFRVYNCFGKILPCFWHPDTHATEFVTPPEIERYGLYELERISRKIALISGYTWFSTEIALTLRDGRPTFLPIDYLNNKCFMLTHAEFGPSGMPVVVAETVAREIAEQTYRHARRFAGRRPVPSYHYSAA
jgi:hypothetical protein